MRALQEIHHLSTIAKCLLNDPMQQEEARTGFRQDVRIEPGQIKVLNALIQNPIDACDGPIIQQQKIDTDSPPLTQYPHDIPVKPSSLFIRKYATARP